ncbi:MAG TPA: hypothetical protein VGO22_09850 [Pseudorhizobium sp.]|jgi:hypothetical protein|nr:hypothetical protein [Pseudorhizobium sp.]
MIASRIVGIEVRRDLIRQIIAARQDLSGARADDGCIIDLVLIQLR